MENINNQEEFNMEKYNDFLKNIKAGSPVHKINFALECPNAVVGMYLISMENVKEYMYKSLDCTDLNYDTLLVFESRHVVECCQVIYGALNVLKNINMFRIDYKVLINEVIDTVLTKPSFYTNVKKELKNIAFNLINLDKTEASEEIYKRFLYILLNIWFIPYGRIDEMAKEGIEEFKKHCEEGNKND